MILHLHTQTFHTYIYIDALCTDIFLHLGMSSVNFFVKYIYTM
jgi:hypothetical protein